MKRTLHPRRDSVKPAFPGGWLPAQAVRTHNGSPTRQGIHRQSHRPLREERQEDSQEWLSHHLSKGQRSPAVGLGRSRAVA